MSNRIVNPESIAKIAILYQSINYNRWTLELSEESKKAFTLCRDQFGYFKGDQICRYLAINNYLAYASRYNTNATPEAIEAYYAECIDILNKMDLIAPKWEDGRRIVSPEIMQFYKTLQCYLYQVDSDLTYQNDIYKSIDSLINQLGKWIIANSDLYNSCEWE